MSWVSDSLNDGSVYVRRGQTQEGSNGGTGIIALLMQQGLEEN